MAERILEGSLKAISVPDLLTFVSMVGKTGTLALRDGDRVRKIYWEKGDMVFATSSDPEGSLGAFLIRHGKITQEQNMKSGLQVQPGKRQGKVLVQMGVLTPKELWWAVKNQVLEIVYGCFSLADGYFTFEETTEPNGEKIRLSTTTTNIILEGIRRLDESPRIKELIPNDRIVLQPAPAESRDKTVKFLEGEEAVLSLIDGKRDVREIIYRSDLGEFETLRVLMALILARYATIPRTEKAPAFEEVDDVSALEEMVVSYNRIFSRILDGLGKHLDPGEVDVFSKRALDSAMGPVLEGIDFDEHGCLDAKVLTANVADLHVEERLSALDGALSNLLSFFLFEASKNLDPEEKSTIYRLAGERASLPSA